VVLLLFWISDTQRFCFFFKKKTDNSSLLPYGYWWSQVVRLLTSNVPERKQGFVHVRCSFCRYIILFFELTHPIFVLSWSPLRSLSIMWLIVSYKLFQADNSCRWVQIMIISEANWYDKVSWRQAQIFRTFLWCLSIYIIENDV